MVTTPAHRLPHLQRGLRSAAEGQVRRITYDWDVEQRRQRIEAVKQYALIALYSFGLVTMGFLLGAGWPGK